MAETIRHVKYDSYCMHPLYLITDLVVRRMLSRELYNTDTGVNATGKTRQELKRYIIINYYANVQCINYSVRFRHATPTQ